MAGSFVLTIPFLFPIILEPAGSKREKARGSHWSGHCALEMNILKAQSPPQLGRSRPGLWVVGLILNIELTLSRTKSGEFSDSHFRTSNHSAITTRKKNNKETSEADGDYFITQSPKSKASSFSSHSFFPFPRQIETFQRSQASVRNALERLERFSERTQESTNGITVIPFRYPFSLYRVSVPVAFSATRTTLTKDFAVSMLLTNEHRLNLLCSSSLSSLLDQTMTVRYFSPTTTIANAGQEGCPGKGGRCRLGNRCSS